MQEELKFEPEPKSSRLEHENLYISSDHAKKLDVLKSIRKDAAIRNLRRAAEAEIDRMYALAVGIGG